MRKIKMNEIKDAIKELMVNDKEEILYCISDGLYIFRSQNGAINDKYLTGNHNIIELGQSGGTIVQSDGDVGLALFKYNGWNQAKEWFARIYDYMKNKELDIEINGNDLITEGKYKVASYATIHVGNNKIYSTIQISLNANPNLINDICLKPMVKIPKGLSEYGITTEEIVELVNKIASDFNE